jgi:Zn-dependent protease with chaperone function
LGFVWFSIIGCATTPMTNRRQLLLVPESQEITMGLDSFNQMLSSEQSSTNQAWIEMVNRVGQRLAAAAERPDYEWEFRVIQSAQQNAFCLPGGKVAIYEGILPVCQSEAGLAVVMAHEVAHALARHGGERMSQSYVVDGMGRALSYLNQTQQVVTQEQLSRAYGIASEYGFVLPYSRKHESEADHMGILLMAKAGYDPREAPRFWQRFGQVKTGSQPEFLSTHPNDERRAADLLELLPEAMAVYQRSPQLGLGGMIDFPSGAASASPPSGPRTTSLVANPDSADSAGAASQKVAAPFSLLDLPPSQETVATNATQGADQPIARQPAAESMLAPMGTQNPLRGTAP